MDFQVVLVLRSPSVLKNDFWFWVERSKIMDSLLDGEGLFTMSLTRERSLFQYRWRFPYWKNIPELSSRNLVFYSDCKFISNM